MRKGTVGQPPPPQYQVWGDAVDRGGAGDEREMGRVLGSSWAVFLSKGAAKIMQRNMEGGNRSVLALMERHLEGLYLATQMEADRDLRPQRQRN